ncbi:MAG: bifunctional 2-polyprenyl-6-hydroxyphenol methylase/3-demethylubiquinol 3-O-methyltransferase UbiG [Alphaproteobacteria bacterium]|nr:bifunctional 2-polyprenyl-6-hydroxyphenol methylase/3-demethylubiquinol 3-O-methyltransferase UbiG [Alphaproteobacteria bacterium]
MDGRDGTVDPSEISRFDAQTDAWWNTEGNFRALHRLNPIRLDFIRSRLVDHFRRDPTSLRPFTRLDLLDIGCGGGLVAEPMCRLGFAVTGIDAAVGGIDAAREHAAAGGLAIDYRVSTPESIADGGQQFDAVLALEVIEHIADRDTFLRSLGRLVTPGGAAILTTLNRTPRSFVQAVVVAEFILGWVPPGTHDWRKFVRPSELILGLHRNGLRPTQIAGFRYELGSGEWKLSRDIDVNYLVLATRI